jgi:hypothetical protein
MAIEMVTSSTFSTSSSGLPMYRVQFLNAETGEVVSDVDVVTSADCVKYINDNPLIKEGLGFKKGESVDADLKTLVDNVLYPYYPPEFVSIENKSGLLEFDKYIETDQKIYVEKGTFKSKFTLAVTVMAGSKTLVSCTLVRMQNDIRDVIETKVLTVVAGAKSTLDFNVPAFTNDVEYFFEISDNENVVQSIKINYEFALPVYVGYAKDGLLDSSLSIDEVNSYLDKLILDTTRVEKRIVEINTPQKAFSM